MARDESSVDTCTCTLAMWSSVHGREKMPRNLNERRSRLTSLIATAKYAARPPLLQWLRAHDAPRHADGQPHAAADDVRRDHVSTCASQTRPLPSARLWETLRQICSASPSSRPCRLASAPAAARPIRHRLPPCDASASLPRTILTGSCLRPSLSLSLTGRVSAPNPPTRSLTRGAFRRWAPMRRCAGSATPS